MMEKNKRYNNFQNKDFQWISSELFTEKHNSMTKNDAGYLTNFIRATISKVQLRIQEQRAYRLL